jgi:hypothetical protein
MSLQNVISNIKTGLSSEKTQDLKNEILKREASENLFPLQIFHPTLKPMINAWNVSYDLDPGFIGLSILSAYSTAIGTAFAVTTKKQPTREDFIYLSVWACNVGISSSGKSTVLNRAYSPLFEIQREFDNEWLSETKGLGEMQVAQKQMPTVIFQDTYIPTLVRAVLPDNPKGVCKWSDELLEWINSMDPSAKGGKEGTDQQFWLKTWNCTPAMVTRSGKQKTVLPRPFVNVVGGTQHELLPKFFAKERDITGYIFRLLFAIDDRNIAIDVDPFFEMPKEFVEPYHRSIQLLYKQFNVESTEDEPAACILTDECILMYHKWVKTKTKQINQLEEVRDRNIQHGIFGKIKEYAQRFSAILYVMDRALDNWNYIHPHDVRLQRSHNYVTVDYMERAIQACEYFHKSATITYERVQKQRYAPEAAIITANMMKANKNMTDIANVVFVGKSKSAEGRRQMLNRSLKKWYLDYSWLFNSTK